VRARRILALGGGTFASGARDRTLSDYLLTLAASEEPRICLLPTAGGDSDDEIRRFYMAFGQRPCVPSALSLFRLGQRPQSVRGHLLGQDVIFVGGGSMLNLLAIWRLHGLDRILREAWEGGTVLCGLSAGSMCWFDQAITTSHGRPEPARGLGLLPGSNCVHYASQPERRAAYHEAILAGMPAGFGVDDGAGLLFEEGQLADVVATRPAALARRVERMDSKIVETPLLPRHLEPKAPSLLDAAPLEEFRSAARRRVAASRRARRGA
jgi:dipeptidase E